MKEHKNGKVTYEHQMLAAVIVHPDLKEVIPLAPDRFRNRMAAPRTIASGMRPALPKSALHPT